MIKVVELNNIEVLAEMAIRLWQDSSLEELLEDFEKSLSNSNMRFFIKYVNDMPIGFAQCSLRFDYVEGTQSTPVGYLEGIYIEKEYRNKGYARELMSACEDWAREKGCREFASDCQLDNIESLRFHLATGFKETNRIICFTKNI